jgi:hypothetical protein
VLHRDGVIEMSYRELAAKDAIVGIYPALTSEEKPLATLGAEAHPDVAAHLDIRSLKLSVVDGAFLKSHSRNAQTGADCRRSGIERCQVPGDL